MGHIYKAIVIGAGITGLACAFRLRQLGIPALLLEASNQAGGLISSLRRNGFLFEAGPQGPRFPQPVWTLVRELKLENEFVPGDPKAKRYILRDGRLHLAPLSPMSLLSTNLLSMHSKYRLLSEALRHTRPPPTEESLAEFAPRSRTIWLTRSCRHFSSVTLKNWACSARFRRLSSGSAAPEA